MKKKLLFSLAVFAGLSVYAQDRTTVQENTPISRKQNDVRVENTNVFVSPYKPTTTKSTNAISKLLFASSANVYGYLTGSSNPLDYNADLNMILFTHRGGGVFGNGSGDIKFKISSDFGLTWDSVVYSSGNANRYPGGALFYEGTPSAANAYVVGSGPITTATVWDKNFVFSAKIDGTNAVDTIFTNIAGTYLNPLNNNQVVTTDGYFHTFSELLTGTTGAVKNGAFMTSGQWNNTTHKFNFKPQVNIRHACDTAMPPVQPSSMSWSKDGSIGYYVFTGQDSLNAPNKAQQPIIYKTTNKGATWQLIPIADFSQVAALQDYIWPLKSDTTRIRPSFPYGYTTSEKELPSVVDANGNLHILTMIQGFTSEHQDSLNYTYLFETNKMFDLIYKTDGTYDVKYIDSLKADVVTDDNSSYGATGETIGWDHWYQISKSDDGTKIFVTWTDTDPSFVADNTLPDLLGKAFDLTTGDETPTKHFTVDGEGMIQYLRAAKTVKTNSGGTSWSVPATCLDTDMGSSTGPTAPVGVWFIQGVDYSAGDFTSVKEYSKVNNFFVTQNYPNPANGLTSIDVVLNENSNLSVAIYDLVGKKVMEVNNGFVVAGKHTLSFNVENLTKGMYIYKVSVNENSVSNKFVVE